MERDERYAAEIRDYLVGRLAKHRTAGSIEPRAPHAQLPAPARRWWIFEGKRYAGLDGPLCSSWSKVASQALRLLSSFSPRWRALDQPEGRVDWTRTLQWNVGLPRQEYICDTTHMGLNPEEHAALCGWIAWVLDEWREYTQAATMLEEADTISSLALLSTDRTTHPSDPPLRRWAHAARRSRWPLLRNVIAESLRCSLESEELDKLPLPEERYELFELLCMVRILKHLNPTPTTIRWLMPSGDGNEVVADGIRCHYQRSFPTEIVLGSEEFAGPLAEAMDVFRVRVPRFADLLFRLEGQPFDNILVEVKSGSQTFDAALMQLKAYRAAMARLHMGRTLVWAIVEHPQHELGSEAVECLHRATDEAAKEVWAFSGADDVADVLRAVRVTSREATPLINDTTALAS